MEDETKQTKADYGWLNDNNQFVLTAGDADGFQMTGLQNGAYYIKEVTAPKDYVITNEVPLTFTVTDGIVSSPQYDPLEVLYDQATTFSIKNHLGVDLPKTGGPGTALYGLLGGLMVVTAGAVLTLRKKKNKA